MLRASRHREPPPAGAGGQGARERTALGVAAVGAATHLVLWSRGFVRGSFGRLRAARRFAWIVLALQLAAFAAGNVMYPTYKVEVRAAYLENVAKHQQQIKEGIAKLHVQHLLLNTSRPFDEALAVFLAQRMGRK